MKIEFISDPQSLSMNEHWFEISNEDHFWFRWRFDAFKKFLKEQKISFKDNLKALDIGGGTGILSSQIEAESNWDTDIADLDINALKNVNLKRGRKLFYNIHDNDQGLQEQYDLILLFDVIEHIKNPSMFIQDAVKHLKPGGKIVINVPALNCFFSPYDKVMGHYRRYSKNSLSKEIRELSFKNPKYHYWGLFLLPFLIVRKIVLSFSKKSEHEIINTGFQPPNSFVNRVFKLLGKIEYFLFRYQIIGTSLLMIAEKKQK
ncbi:class I SAM-dependent methyltransferase [Bacteriovoracales bacterium]|nr:class I SAM-dependent methyltransferase [Bacteriovoracales bacterium]